MHVFLATSVRNHAFHISTEINHAIPTSTDINQAFSTTTDINHAFLLLLLYVTVRSGTYRDKSPVCLYFISILYMTELKKRNKIVIHLIELKNRKWYYRYDIGV
jgi:hypothetical protein